MLVGEDTAVVWVPLACRLFSEPQIFNLAKLGGGLENAAFRALLRSKPSLILKPFLATHPGAVIVSDPFGCEVLSGLSS